MSFEGNLFAAAASAILGKNPKGGASLPGVGPGLPFALASTPSEAAADSQVAAVNRIDFRLSASNPPLASGVTGDWLYLDPVYSLGTVLLGLNPTDAGGASQVALSPGQTIVGTFKGFTLSAPTCAAGRLVFGTGRLIQPASGFTPPLFNFSDTTPIDFGSPVVVTEPRLTLNPVPLSAGPTRFEFVDDGPPGAVAVGLRNAQIHVVSAIAPLPLAAPLFGNAPVCSWSDPTDFHYQQNIGACRLADRMVYSDGATAVQVITWDVPDSLIVSPNIGTMGAAAAKFKVLFYADDTATKAWCMLTGEQWRFK